MKDTTELSSEDLIAEAYAVIGCSTSASSAGSTDSIGVASYPYTKESSCTRSRVAAHELPAPQGSPVAPTPISSAYTVGQSKLPAPTGMPLAAKQPVQPTRPALPVQQAHPVQAPQAVQPTQVARAAGATKTTQAAQKARAAQRARTIQARRSEYQDSKRKAGRTSWLFYLIVAIVIGLVMALGSRD